MHFTAAGNVVARPAADGFVDLERMKRIADGSDPTPAVCALRRPEYLGTPGNPRCARPWRCWSATGSW